MKKTIITLLLSIALPLVQAHALPSDLSNDQLIRLKIQNMRAKEALSTSEAELNSKIQSVKTGAKINLGLRLFSLASGLTAAGTFMWGPTHGGKTDIMKKGTQIVFWSSVVLSILSSSLASSTQQSLDLEINEAIELRKNLQNAQRVLNNERDEIEAQMMARQL